MSYVVVAPEMMAIAVVSAIIQAAIAVIGG
jgi:hypothetical protein